MKAKVNTAFLNYLTGPMNGGADDDDMVKEYIDLDANNELLVKEIIKSRLLPNYLSRSPIFKKKLKIALSYSLSSTTHWGSQYDSVLLPFDHPDDPRLFYLWIWEVFFPKERFMIDKCGDFEEVQDFNEPLLILRREKSR